MPALTACAWNGRDRGCRTLSIIAPFVQTAAGRSNFSIMLKNHNETFPNYIAEIAGMAEVGAVAPAAPCSRHACCVTTLLLNFYLAWKCFVWCFIMRVH